jgi:hypothetical protein
MVSVTSQWNAQLKEHWMTTNDARLHADFLAGDHSSERHWNRFMSSINA